MKMKIERWNKLTAYGGHVSSLLFGAGFQDYVFSVSRTGNYDLLSKGRYLFLMIIQGCKVLHFNAFITFP